jgi:hypothetical protein
MSHSKFVLPLFSKETPNKIANGLRVPQKNTLKKISEDTCSVAIADEPIDATVNANHMFCVRVENSGENSMLLVGFTPLSTFNSRKEAYFGSNKLSGCGLLCMLGDLNYPENSYYHIINPRTSAKAKEIIVLLTVSENGAKKVIQFLCDGKESKTSDVSDILKEDSLFPAICLCEKDQEVTTIPIDEITIRTEQVETLLFAQKKKNTKEKRVAKKMKKTKKEVSRKGKATKKRGEQKK